MVSRHVHDGANPLTRLARQNQWRDSWPPVRDGPWPGVLLASTSINWSGGRGVGGARISDVIATRCSAVSSRRGEYGSAKAFRSHGGLLLLSAIGSRPFGGGGRQGH